MRKTQEGIAMDYRAAGMLSTSMACPHTTVLPNCEEKHLLGRQKGWGGSHTLLRHPVQKQTILHEFIRNDKVQH